MIISALVEGVARAGNGFAQSVGQGEKLDGKVIRMLRGALTPDHGAFTMEIQYQKEEDEDEFVMVERVSDSLRVLELDEDDWPDAQLGKELTASAQTTAGGNKNVGMAGADGQARSNHLPTVPVPKLMQTPQKVPPLYPFSRTNVYVLISPEAAQGSIKSVILKGSCIESPFKMEIPIEVLLERGEIIHQLAAKKAVAELEEGRGWLVHAKDEKGVIIKEKYCARFQTMVEREAVRLGIQYQIAGKFTSFVATETDPENPKNTVSHKAGVVVEAEGSASPDESFCESFIPCSASLTTTPQTKSNGGSLFGATVSMASTPQPKSSSGSLFSASLQPMSSGGYLFSSSLQPMSSGGSLFGASLQRKSSGGSLFGAAANASTYDRDTKVDEADPLQKIIALQTFEGCWNLEAPLLDVVGLSAQHNVPQGVDSKVWATVLAITFLEEKMAGDKESWEMLVEKARAWLEGTEERVFEGKWTLAKQLIMGPD